MKTLLTVLLILVLLLGGALAWVTTRGVSLHLGAAVLQPLVEAGFPIREQRLGLEYGLHDPQLRITPGGRIGLAARVEVVRDGRRLEGRFDASGRPYYDPERQALYLRRVTVHDLGVDRVALEDESQGSGISEALSGVLSRTGSGQGGWLMTLLGEQLAAAIESRPLLALDPGRWEQRLLAGLLRDVRVEGQDLVVELGGS
ncbi:MAG: DUF1439 domain-containing protein [Candidatus Competibacteraceae bacterium]|nr:DUF1439 domain-containing protein [Candidatus Competibacteraceae bacterium]